MKLKATYIDVDTGNVIALLHDDDAKEIGVREGDRVKVIHEGNTVIALVNLSDTYMSRGYVGLLGNAFKLVGPEEEEVIEVILAPRPESVDYIKKKMDGQELKTPEIESIIQDISSHSLSPTELGAYVTALHIRGMNVRETADLTISMVKTGETIKFDKGPIYDFHSIGGVPGNKITLLVVPIVAAAGCLIPKTSSRAISSACGTADIVETFCKVDLDARKLKKITEEVGGVLAWGGSLGLAPADDLIIKAEYPLGIDPHPQLLASVMSKKKAASADFLLMDIPMGDGTKIKSMDEAKALARDFIALGEKLGIKVECAITYGGQPVGRAIGPALEAREAIQIMEGAKTPSSTIEKTVAISGMLLDMGGGYGGALRARDILTSGKALEKFRQIVEAQGGKENITSDDIKVGEFAVDVLARRTGYVSVIKNKELVKIARAAGSPNSKGAGIMLAKKAGMKVDQGEKIFTIYADNMDKLQLALKTAEKLEPVLVAGMILETVPTFTRVEF
jgi:AMP phosphorylase